MIVMYKMLETINQYIKDLPNMSFEEYYQQYILNIQDENIGIETCFPDTFYHIDKLLARIQKELTK